jgi:hypothetical protein
MEAAVPRKLPEDTVHEPSNIETLYRPDASRVHAPVGDIKPLPNQHRHAVERAEDLVLGRPPRHFPANAQIAEAEAWLVSVGRSNPVGMVALEIFREGRRSIEARRDGPAPKS